MRSFLITIAAFLLLPNIVCAQKINIDSLERKLNSVVQKQIDQITLYKEIVSYYADIDPDKTIELSEKAVALTQKENDKKMSSWFYAALGKAYGTKGIYDKSVVNWNKSLDIAIKTGDKNQEAAALTGIGNTYGLQSRYHESLEYFLKALPILEDIGDEKQQINVLCNINSIHRAMNDFERASVYLEQARKLADKTNDPDSKIKVYYNLGAISFYTNPAKALEYMLVAVAVADSVDNKYYRSNGRQALSMIYSKVLNEPDKALIYATECLEISKEIGDQNNILGAYNALANIYREQKNYAACEAAALQGMAIDSTNLEMGIDQTANITLANIYLGNKEKAAEFFWKYSDIVEKYIDKNTKEALLGLEVKYETEKKETQIATLEQEKLLYIWIGIACFVILVLVIGLLIIRHRLAKQHVKQLKKEKQLIATQAVLDGETAERTRLAKDLHDGLGSSLSVMKFKLDEMRKKNEEQDEMERVLGMLDESIFELRQVAHNLMPDSLLRNGLRASVADFCETIPHVQFLFFGNEKRLEPKLEVMIYRTIHELVNNALKHANASSIIVQIIQEDDRIAITVQDNGCGFDELKLNNGMGIKNIRNRVESYQGILNISSKIGEGTEINIELKLDEI